MIIIFFPLAGLVGLAITYALSVTGLLNGVVNAFTETEREMIAVERVNQYIEEVQPENTTFVIDPPYGWPSQGVIVFDDVVLNYRFVFFTSFLSAYCSRRKLRQREITLF